jgi:hypothetical protein
MTRNVYFKVAFSDGTNHFEHKDGDWKSLPDKEITALGLYTLTGRNYHLPSNTRLPLETFLQKHPKWRWIKIHTPQGMDDVKVADVDDLLFFIKDRIKDKTVTGIQFFDFKGKGTYLGLESENPKFQAFFSGDKVERYEFYRKYGADRDLNGKIATEETFAVATAHYKNHALQIWVSEERPENMWSLVI